MSPTRLPEVWNMNWEQVISWNKSGRGLVISHEIMVYLWEFQMNNCTYSVTCKFTAQWTANPKILYFISSLMKERLMSSVNYAFILGFKGGYRPYDWDEVVCGNRVQLGGRMASYKYWTPLITIIIGTNLRTPGYQHDCSSGSNC